MTPCRPMGIFVDAVRERHEQCGIHRGLFAYFPDAHTSATEPR